MHVDHAPRCEHSLLVGVVEIREYGADASHAFVHMHVVGLARQLAVTLARSNEDGGIVAFLKLAECGFVDTARHKLFPRVVVNHTGEVVERYTLVLIVYLRPKHHKGYAQRDAPKHGDAVVALLALLSLAFLFGLKGGLLLFCELLVFPPLPLGTLGSRLLFGGELVA